ncbi:MAG: hypothetical protein WCH62_06070, partial [Candidatus Omnitrophota bacterium]
MKKACLMVLAIPVGIYLAVVSFFRPVAYVTQQRANQRIVRRMHWNFPSGHAPEALPQDIIDSIVAHEKVHLKDKARGEYKALKAQAQMFKRRRVLRKELKKLYQSYYQQRIPKGVAEVLLSPLANGQVKIDAIDRVLSTLKDSYSLKPQMSEELARVMINFLILVDPDRDPLTMTHRNRYTPMLKWMKNRSGGTGVDWSVCSPNGLAVEIGLGFKPHPMMEWSQIWNGQMLGLDYSLPEYHLAVRGYDKRTNQRVTLHILLNKVGTISKKELKDLL